MHDQQPRDSAVLLYSVTLLAAAADAVREAREGLLPRAARVEESRTQGTGLADCNWILLRVFCS